MSSSTPLAQYRDLLVTYLRPQWPRVLVLGFLVLTNIGLQLLNPQILRGFLDTAIAGGSLSVLTTTAVIFIVVALASQVLTVISTYVSEYVGWNATNELRADLALHSLRLDMSFHNRHTPGEMIERIDGDVTNLSKFFSQFIVQVASNMLLMVGVLVMLFREDWRIGLALTIFAVIAIALLLRVRNVAVPHMKAEREASADLFGYIEERISGLDDIRSNGAKAYVMQRFHAAMRQLYRKGGKAWFSMNIIWMLTMGLFTVAYLIAFAMGAYLHGAGVLTIGTVYLLVHYTEMLRRPVDDLTGQMEQLQKAGAGIQRIRELRAQSSSVTDGSIANIPAGPLCVELDDVSFNYDGDEAVIKELSLKIEPGKTLGLLGRTGSGKTTLTRLLLRLYDPAAGTIRLGDVDIREARLDELRSRVAMVTQDVQLFNATVRDNLTLFDTSIPDERILQVLRDVGLYGWYLSLPNGLDSVLGPSGGGLSAGEAQLLAFTRVFLKEPGLVILDEASSRLDPATEKLVEEAVKKLMRDRTGIIIAHRLGTVRHVDDILILEDGQASEYGPRDELARDPDSRFYSLLRTGLEEALA